MTRSTDILLSMLGYRTLHFPKFFGGQNLMEAVRGLESSPARVVEALRPAITHYDALSDVPIPGLYRELAERWPDSRFILVTRDPEAWARSVRGHMNERAMSPFNKIQYRPYIGHSRRRVSEAGESELASIHNRHTEAVRAYFESVRGEPERLCIAPMAEGDPGERICRFLGHDPRPMPFLSGRASERDLATAWEWVDARPDKSDAHYLLAANLHQRGSPREALEHLHQAVRVEPNQPKPYALMARILEEQGDNMGAAEASERAIDLGLSKRRLINRAVANRLRKGRPLDAARLWLGGLRHRLRKH
jgi:tetratricopeptide (TPR) repeat protein